MIESIKEVLSDIDDLIERLDDEDAGLLNDIAYKLELALNKYIFESKGKNTKER